MAIFKLHFFKKSRRYVSTNVLPSYYEISSMTLGGST